MTPNAAKGFYRTGLVWQRGSAAGSQLPRHSCEEYPVVCLHISMLRELNNQKPWWAGFRHRAGERRKTAASGKMQGGEITMTWQRAILELARSPQGWREFVATPRNRIVVTIHSSKTLLIAFSQKGLSRRNNIVHNTGNFCLSYRWIHRNREK